MNKTEKLLIWIITFLLFSFLVYAASVNWNGELFRVDGNMNVTGDIYTNAHYAQYDYHNDTDPEVIILSVEDQYENITGLHNSYAKGIMPSDGGATINRTSMYNLQGSIAFNGGNSGEYQFSLFVNEVAEHACSAMRSTDSNAMGSMSISCLVALNEGDKVRMKVRDTTAPVQNANIYLLTFNMIEVT